jgi:hypothetical protein
MRALLAIALLACGEVEPQPLRITASATRAGHEQHFDAMRRLSEDITRYTCVSVALYDDKPEGPAGLRAGVRVEWTSPTEMERRYNGVIPVSALVGPPGITVLMAVDGEHPSDRWVAPDPCEVGYLWAHWIAYMGGAGQQSTDKTRITYWHPSCPDGKPPFDLVDAINRELCQ